MDVAQILRELSRRRGWVIASVLVAVCIGVLTAYRPVGFPPTLEKRALVLGTAQTKVIIDSPRSSLVDPDQDLERVAQRGMVYAEVMTTDTLTRPIAKRAGLERNQLGVVSGRSGEPGAQQRSPQIVNEGRPYQIFTKGATGSPVVTISTQGPDAEGAVKLANAGAAELSRYVESLRKRPNALQVRQLGRARGGVINQGANQMVTVIATLGTFVALCLLILLGSSVADSSRRLRAAGGRASVRPHAGPAVPAAAPTNGDGHDGQQEDADLAAVRSLRQR